MSSLGQIHNPDIEIMYGRASIVSPAASLELRQSSQGAILTLQGYGGRRPASIELPKDQVVEFARDAGTSVST